MASTLEAARAYIADQLRTHAPAGWRIIADESNPDTLDRTTVLLSITNVARLAGAPMGAFDVTVQATIADPRYDNLPAAEGPLLAALGDLLALIEDHLHTAWEPATKALYAGRYLCWDINLHVSTTRTD